MALTIPPADIHPPKHMAQMISQMVPIMPLMPRVATRSVSMGEEVASDVLP